MNKKLLITTLKFSFYVYGFLFFISFRDLFHSLNCLFDVGLCENTNKALEKYCVL